MVCILQRLQLYELAVIREVFDHSCLCSSETKLQHQDLSRAMAENEGRTVIHSFKEVFIEHLLCAT